MSASHKYKLGTPEWHASYNDFIAKNVSGKRWYRKLTHNASIFASRMAPGLYGTDVWDRLFRNYIERRMLLDEVKERQLDLERVPLSVPDRVNGTRA